MYSKVIVYGKVWVYDKVWLYYTLNYGKVLLCGMVLCVVRNHHTIY